MTSEDCSKCTLINRFSSFNDYLHSIIQRIILNEVLRMFWHPLLTTFILFNTPLRQDSFTHLPQDFVFISLPQDSFTHFPYILSSFLYRKIRSHTFLNILSSLLYRKIRSHTFLKFLFVPTLRYRKFLSTALLLTFQYRKTIVTHLSQLFFYIAFPQDYVTHFPQVIFSELVYRKNFSHTFFLQSVSARSVTHFPQLFILHCVTAIFGHIIAPKFHVYTPHCTLYFKHWLQKLSICSSYSEYTRTQLKGKLIYSVQSWFYSRTDIKVPYIWSGIHSSYTFTWKSNSDNKISAQVTKMVTFILKHTLIRTIVMPLSKAK